jgi:hypothetical protein
LRSLRENGETPFLFVCFQRTALSSLAEREVSR